MLDSLVNDVRYAARWLVRSPGFACVAICSLGLGIGFNTAIFSVVDALLLRPPPVADPASLVDLYTSGADGDRYSTSSLPDIEDYRARVKTFEGIAAYSPMIAPVSRGDRARLVLGEIVTGNYFSLLGVAARVGRTIEPSDDVPGAERVVVLSNRYWQRELGGDPQMLGRSIRIGGHRFAIVGVLGDEFTGMVPMLAPEIWIATRYIDDVEQAGISETVPSPTGTSRLDRRGQRWLFAKARLAAGSRIDDARAEMDVLSARLGAEHPQTNKDRRVSLRRASETRIHPDADGLVAWVVAGTMGAVAVVLLIACANVAGMLLARASARQREIAVRLAVGAGRRRLVQQLLTESVMLGGLGAALGVALAWWLMQGLTTYELPIPVPLSLDLRLDARVLAFTAFAGLVTGVVAGLVPALRATRRDLVSDLKGATATERVGARRWTARDLLVAGQIAFTALLLVVSGLLLRSLFASERAEVGFTAEGVAFVSADTEMVQYTSERSEQFWAEAERRLRAIPGVEHVALASRLPFSFNFNRTNIAVPGRQQLADETGPPIDSADVSPDYFTTFGIPVLEGRAFTDTDTADAPAVAIVNESMAVRFWPGESAIGKVVYERTLASGQPLRIVGVVADHTVRRVGEDRLPVIYRPTPARRDSHHVIAARTRGDEKALLVAIRQALLALEPDLLFVESGTLRGQISATLFPVRAAATLVGIFSGLGLLLAAIGLYGVVAFTVALRTRDFGVRLAIGARPGQLVALVMRQGLGLALAGTLAGFALAAMATTVVARALYGVGVADPVAWGLAAGILLLVAAAANLLPALRAMRLDPARALRAE